MTSPGTVYISHTKGTHFPLARISSSIPPWIYPWVSLTPGGWGPSLAAGPSLAPLAPLLVSGGTGCNSRFKLKLSHRTPHILFTLGLNFLNFTLLNIFGVSGIHRACPLYHCRRYSVNTHATNPNPPGTEPGQSRIKRRGGSCISGSADSQYPQNNWNSWALLQLQIRPSLLLWRKIPPWNWYYNRSSLWSLTQLPTQSLKIYYPLCAQTLRDEGDFLINSGKRSYCTCNLYWVYKGFGYHSQYTTPIHQYTSPAAILQPHNMVFNLQKP